MLMEAWLVEMTETMRDSCDICAFHHYGLGYGWAPTEPPLHICKPNTQRGLSLRDRQRMGKQAAKLNRARRGRHERRRTYTKFKKFKAAA